MNSCLTDTDRENYQMIQFLKWIKDINRNYSEKDIQMANKLMKGCLISSIGKMQNKITMRFNYIPIRQVTIKNNDNTQCS